MHRPTTASLLDLDPELAAALPADEVAGVRAATGVASIVLEPGPVSPSELADGGRRVFALVVLNGLLVRDHLLAQTASSELLGPGDIASTGPSEAEFLQVGTRWTVVVPTRAALLDDRLSAALRAWPSLASRLMARASEQIARMATQRAISQLPRVEDRLLALFWHLAERWGRVGTAGIVVPLALTHSMLGRLVGARRPTVSLALKDLAQRELLGRRDDGAWVVSLDSLFSSDAESDGDGALGPAGGIAIVDTIERPDVRSQPMPEPSTPADVAALHHRIADLRRDHQIRLAHVAATLARSRKARDEAQRLRDVRGGPAAPSAAPPPSDPPAPRSGEGR